jgi:phosphoesterase RecJ-like protein
MARKPAMNKKSEIASVLLQCESVLVSVHKSPDGDALGSQLALTAALEGLGKRVVAWNLDPVPEVYRFLPGSNKIRTGPVEGRYDALVVLDADPPRTGLFDNGYPADRLMNIDHHVTNTGGWDLTWLDPSASATGEMIHDLVRFMNVPLTKEIALCLYTSIFTDTGSFRYSSTSARSMRIAADMIEAGAEPWLVTEHVYESFAFRRLKLLGSVLSDMERSEDGIIAWVVVTDKLFRQHGASAEDTENFVNFVRSVRGVEVAVLFRQIGEAEYKISLRSKGRVDVTRPALVLGGGGHKNAAGCTVSGSLEQVKSRVIGEIRKVVGSPREGKSLEYERRS